ncbi:MAG: hypothetical protein A4E28_02441 [Methanocella sp. PtaU1.Bin125]|nr:MAG: hypothetical protein A4E28_02441 [Methanocella sp. PtaU1.Bin125]
MPEKPLELDVVRHHVLRRQHLAGSTAPVSLVQVARDVGGLHSTMPATPYLSLFSRVPGFSRDQLDEELYVKKSLIRMRCVRNTLYVLPRTMVPAAFTATKRLTVPNSERFCKYRGVDEAEYKRAAPLIVDLVRGGGKTTAEIKAALEPSTSIPAMLILMCDRGVLARGKPPNWRSNAYRYHLFSEYYPGVKLDRPDEAEATRQLISMYVAAFGPVTAGDIAWWTGLGKKTVTDVLAQLPVAYCAIAGLDGEFVMLRRETKWLAGQQDAPKRTVNFLPGLDGYIMGYKQRDRYMDRNICDFVFDRSGNAAPTILIDGRIAGIWDFTLEDEPVVKYCLFDRDAIGPELPEIVRKAAEIGNFIAGMRVRLKECHNVEPLTKRTAGAVMAPLKGQ